MSDPDYYQDPRERMSSETLDMLRELMDRVEVLEMAVVNLSRDRKREENDGR